MPIPVISPIKTVILKGPILPSLLKFSIPILISLFLQALYGAVDLWMVGKFAANADVSAVTTGSQTLQIVVGLAVGLSLGITITLGQAMGQANKQRCAHIIGASFWIFTVLSLILTLFLTIASEWLSGFLNAPDVAFDETVSYIRICGFGVISIVWFNVVNAIYTGMGDSKTPLFFVGAACIVNIAGDFLLVGLFGLGAAGAAFATIVAQAVSVGLALYMLRYKLPFRMRKAHFRFHPRLAATIVRLGFPIALQNTCNEISYLALIGFVNLLGVVASSGVGIAEKLVMFILLIPMSFLYSVSAFVAQNFGAKAYKRVEQTLWYGMGLSMTIGALMAYFSMFHGDWMSSLFISDAEVIAASASFLQVTAFECFIFSSVYCFLGYFTGLGKTNFVMIQGMMAIFLVRIPFSYLASHTADPQLVHIGFALVLAAFLMLAMSVGYYWHLRKKGGLEALAAENKI